MDILIAIAGLLIAAPLIIAFALAIHRKSPGPFMFSQQREGQYGRLFTIWKLRTMHIDAEERLQRHLADNPNLASVYAANNCLKHDPRTVGKIGHFARRYSIDEWPQLWNVLKGQMSLVGPRPLTTNDAAVFFDAEAREIRLGVHPGMTGLWQVCRTGKRDVARTMIGFDLDYIRRQSLALDAWILWRTVHAVFSGRGQF